VVVNYLSETLALRLLVPDARQYGAING
jgi:hypothetical protein